MGYNYGYPNYNPTYNYPKYPLPLKPECRTQNPPPILRSRSCLDRDRIGGFRLGTAGLQSLGVLGLGLGFRVQSLRVLGLGCVDSVRAVGALQMGGGTHLSRACVSM